MEATSRRQGPFAPGLARRVDWSAVVTWLLGFGLVAYLGLSGGGYDPLVSDQVGIAVWWVLPAALLVGALPRRLPQPLAWAALGLLAALVAWTALSLAWTESVERSWGELARVVTYLGVFALALFIRGPHGARRMVAAVGTAVAFVATIALLSRFHPAWFPEADQTARFLTDSRERLAYPLNYWNALAALIAIGAPLLLHLATSARTAAARALAAAALPALALAAFLTLSRSGMAGGGIAIAVFLVLCPDRLPRALTALVAAAGGAILILAASGREALQHGLSGPVAERQGDEMLALTIVACAAVGLAQVGISALAAPETRPSWTRLSRRRTLIATTTACLAVLVAGLALGAPGRAADAWSEFKRQGGPGEGSGRLGSASGNGRYQYWRAAVEENKSRPAAGTGSATFVYWWARNGDIPGTVLDAHSLYLQTLGELGVVGIALLAAFLAAILAGGLWATLRAGRRGRPQLAAALSGCLAFCIIAGFDWIWQIPVLPVAFLLLAAVLVSAGPRAAGDERTGLPWPLRGSAALAAVAAILAIAVPLASTTAVRRSQAQARAGDLETALREARSAQNAQPGAASPRLQQALLLESRGDLSLAAAAARAATEREPTSWRTWLVLSRIEAERGHVRAALRAFREARSLNPRSPLFAS